jgi:hypothetical protein
VRIITESGFVLHEEYRIEELERQEHNSHTPGELYAGLTSSCEGAAQLRHAWLSLREKAKRDKIFAHINAANKGYDKLVAFPLAVKKTDQTVAAALAMLMHAWAHLRRQVEPPKHAINIIEGAVEEIRRAQLSVQSFLFEITHPQFRKYRDWQYDSAAKTAERLAQIKRANFLEHFSSFDMGILKGPEHRDRQGVKRLVPFGMIGQPRLGLREWGIAVYKSHGGRSFAERVWRQHYRNQRIVKKTIADNLELYQAQLYLARNSSVKRYLACTTIKGSLESRRNGVYRHGKQNSTCEPKCIHNFIDVKICNRYSMMELQKVCHNCGRSAAYLHNMNEVYQSEMDPELPPVAPSEVWRECVVDLRAGCDNVRTNTGYVQAAMIAAVEAQYYESSHTFWQALKPRTTFPGTDTEIQELFRVRRSTENIRDDDLLRLMERLRRYRKEPKIGIVYNRGRWFLNVSRRSNNGGHEQARLSLFSDPMQNIVQKTCEQRKATHAEEEARAALKKVLRYCSKQEKNAWNQLFEERTDHLQPWREIPGTAAKLSRWVGWVFALKLAGAYTSEYNKVRPEEFEAYPDCKSQMLLRKVDGVWRYEFEADIDQ